MISQVFIYLIFVQISYLFFRPMINNSLHIVVANVGFIVYFMLIYRWWFVICFILVQKKWKKFENRLIFILFLEKNFQVSCSKGLLKIPHWLKILISALLILPIRFWMYHQELMIREPKENSPNFFSPAIAFLQCNRKSSKIHAHSTYRFIFSQ